MESCSTYIEVVGHKKWQSVSLQVWFIARNFIVKQHVIACRHVMMTSYVAAAAGFFWCHIFPPGIPFRHLFSTISAKYSYIFQAISMFVNYDQP